MKFYYNGKLVRTSKTHAYTHAVLTPNGDTFSCSSSREGAVKALQAKINEWEQIRSNYRNAIKALEAGRPYYFSKYGRREVKQSLSGKTVADYDRMLAEAERIIANYNAHQIVELEARD